MKAEAAVAGRPAPVDPARLVAATATARPWSPSAGWSARASPWPPWSAIDVLKAGGTCVDAAIATNAALGLMEPMSCGIGGDLFAIVWVEKDRKLYGLNASGRAPAGWTLEKAKKLGLERIPRRSPLSWSVPGCVSGWKALSERFGRLGLARVLEPSIAYARDGFPLSPIIASGTSAPGATTRRPHLAAVFHPGGRVPGYGDVFQNPLLAASYERIAKDGAAAFYEGETAERIVAKSRELGGYMSLEDLRAHRADWVEPVSSSYRGYDVWEIPPNGQGICALQILNLMEGFDVAAPRPQLGGVPAPLHRGQEARLRGPRPLLRRSRLRQGARARAHLEGATRASARRRSTRARAATERAPTATRKLDSDTVYLCAADGEGNMVSLIQSNYSSFGSDICPDGVGFAMQNRGQAFSLDPGAPQSPRAGQAAVPHHHPGLPDPGRRAR